MKDPKKEIAEELNEVSPFLAKLQQEQKLPKDYFNNFEDRLMARLREEEALSPKAIAKPSKNSSFWAKISWLFAPKYAVAWSLALVVGIFGLKLLQQTPQIKQQATPEELLAALTVEELNTYIDAHLEEFSTEDIIQTMDQQVVDQLPSSEKILVEAKATAATKAPKTIEKEELPISIDDLSEEEILEALEDEDLEELEELF